jgi:hypothetical protein
MLLLLLLFHLRPSARFLDNTRKSWPSDLFFGGGPIMAKGPKESRWPLQLMFRCRKNQ